MVSFLASISDYLLLTNIIQSLFCCRIKYNNSINCVKEIHTVVSGDQTDSNVNNQPSLVLRIKKTHIVHSQQRTVCYINLSSYNPVQVKKSSLSVCCQVASPAYSQSSCYSFEWMPSVMEKKTSLRLSQLICSCLKF